VLDEARIAPDGIPGDRESAFFVVAGHARIGRTFRGKENNLLHLTHDPAQAAEIANRQDVEVDLQRGEHYFDAAPISIVFDTWVREISQGLGRALDYRRWRPNFFVRAAEDFRLLETDLPGAQIEMGSALLRVRKPIERCVTITYDVETGESSPDVLQYTAQERGNRFGIYCDVELAGDVRTGDALRLRAR